MVIAKPGLDGHDRGAKVIARALRDAGMEVIYSGRHNSPESLVEVAIQEDVDVLGVSILAGGHLGLCERIATLLRERNAQDIVFLVGGFIPPEDIPKLKAFGVREVFRDGAKLEEIVQFIAKVATERAAA